MTETGSAEVAGCLSEYINTWCEALGEILARMAGTPVVLQHSLTIPEGMTPGETDLWLSVIADGVLRGEMSVRLPHTIAQGIAKPLAESSQPASAESTDRVRDSIIGIFRQASKRVCDALTQKLGGIQLQVGPGSSPSWPAAAVYCLTASSAGPVNGNFEFRISAALAASTKKQESLSCEPDKATANTSDLLRDVELAVSLRFGSKEMLLRDILELGPGAVIELDQEIGEPLDLLLDGKIIARGEAVVVEGNLGLRVVEIICESRPQQN